MVDPTTRQYQALSGAPIDHASPEGSLVKLRLLVLPLTCLAALVARPAAAQSAAPNPTTDSTSSRTPVTLAPVNVTAPHAQSDRRRVLDLERGNRILAAEARRQGRRIAELETRLDSLKRVGAEREREIARIDSATAATHAARLAVAAQLATLEARSGGVAAADTVRGAGSNTSP
jgi:hypothetical protein